MAHTKSIWTIGHSTRTFKEFLELLKNDAIALLIDVRRFPGSRKFPQFNTQTLESALLDNSIEYKHLEALGGRRRASEDSKNTVWNHPSFRGYADYMETSEFKDAFKELESLASEKRCAIMCSEAVWWRCHRSMISDQLKANGWKVIHIMGENQHQEHPFTKPAKVEDGQLSYH
ncbi:DUF488 domain-containing protein [Gelidibacter sp.]|uniref:DUF488 domain-containing protein n=1 Tax=Gelidibacter sp. TaxID=2018083 RepID=UPI002C77D0BF|nr:DUF488 domain-containing protein [Gelidibacter sp.]HUH28908.1 DUF488 domain-containing protein [Gelidibacter sp.]